MRPALLAGAGIAAAAGALVVALVVVPRLRRDDGDPSLRALEFVKRAETMAADGKFTEARAVLLESLRQLERRDPTAQTAAAFLATLTPLATTETQLEMWVDAEAHARRQIAIAESAVATKELAAHADYLDLGAARFGQGDRAGAEAAYAHALELQAAMPVEQANTHLVIAFFYHKHHEEAVAVDHAQKGAVLAERALGLADPTTLTFHLAECKLLLADHKPALALPTAEKILPLIERSELGPLAIGDARFAVARALPPGDRPRALALAKAAKDELAKAGTDGAAHAADVTRWLAELGN
jgi:hypothetical protein